MEKNQILCVIDPQNDFIYGSLRNEEAINAVPNIIEKINNFEGSQIYVTMDTHKHDYLKTQEGLALPVEHCIKATPGWCIENGIKQALDAAEERNITVTYIEKPTFGSFDLIEEINNNNPGERGKIFHLYIEIIGYCTNICIISNALLLKTRYYGGTISTVADITVDASCCAGVTPESHKAALTVMKSCQINVINE